MVADSNAARGEPLPDHESTDALSERARAKDKEAMEALYVRLVPHLLVWVRAQKKSGLGLPVENEDFISEVWVRVLPRMHEFDVSKGSFRGWVFGFAKRVWIEMCDSRRRLGRRMPSAPDAALEARRDSLTTLTRAIARDELLQRLGDYIESLEPVDRAVLLMHGIEGLSCARTGELLEMSADAISKRWQRLQLRVRESGFGRSFDLDD